MSKPLIYIKSILIPLLIGGLVGIVTSKYIDYTSLLQPSWAPPSFLFPIVWTILYAILYDNSYEKTGNYEFGSGWWIPEKLSVGTGISKEISDCAGRHGIGSPSAGKSQVFPESPGGRGYEKNDSGRSSL